MTHFYSVLTATKESFLHTPQTKRRASMTASGGPGGPGEAGYSVGGPRTVTVEGFFAVPHLNVPLDARKPRRGT